MAIPPPLVVRRCTVQVVSEPPNAVHSIRPSPMRPLLHRQRCPRAHVRERPRSQQQAPCTTLRQAQNLAWQRRHGHGEEVGSEPPKAHQAQMLRGSGATKLSQITSPFGTAAQLMLMLLPLSQLQSHAVFVLALGAAIDATGGCSSQKCENTRSHKGGLHLQGPHILLVPW